MKESKYCIECGCYIPDDWKECPACGFKFENPFGNLRPAEIPVHENLNPKSENENRNQNLKFRFDNSNRKNRFDFTNNGNLITITTKGGEGGQGFIFSDNNYISYITNGTTYIMQGGDWFDTRRI